MGIDVAGSMYFIFCHMENMFFFCRWYDSWKKVHRFCICSFNFCRAPNSRICFLNCSHSSIFSFVWISILNVAAWTRACIMHIHRRTVLALKLIKWIMQACWCAILQLIFAIYMAQLRLDGGQWDLDGMVSKFMNVTDTSYIILRGWSIENRMDLNTLYIPSHSAIYTGNKMIVLKIHGLVFNTPNRIHGGYVKLSNMCSCNVHISYVSKLLISYDSSSEFPLLLLTRTIIQMLTAAEQIPLI